MTGRLHCNIEASQQNQSWYVGRNASALRVIMKRWAGTDGQWHGQVPQSCRFWLQLNTHNEPMLILSNRNSTLWNSMQEFKTIFLLDIYQQIIIIYQDWHAKFATFEVIIWTLPSPLHINNNPLLMLHSSSPVFFLLIWQQRTFWHFSFFLLCEKE